MTPRTFGVAAVDDVVAEAIGHGRRRDPVLARTGGPAGNARLTSWTGLLLLALIAAELITLLDVTGLVRWHVGVGIALVAGTLLKTASTSWRILRYYSGSRSYRTAGPPPTLLRLLGPLVVLATLGVLGSGIALIAIGQRATEHPLITIVGRRVSPLTLHQGFFILFAVFTGLHVLTRFLPAMALASGRGHLDAAPIRVPGRTGRVALVSVAAVAAVVAIVLVLPSVHDWHHHHHFRDLPGSRSQHLARR